VAVAARKLDEKDWFASSTSRRKCGKCTAATHRRANFFGLFATSIDIRHFFHVIVHDADSRNKRLLWLDAFRPSGAEREFTRAEIGDQCKPPLMPRRLPRAIHECGPRTVRHPRCSGTRARANATARRRHARKPQGATRPHRTLSALAPPPSCRRLAAHARHVAATRRARRNAAALPSFCRRSAAAHPSVVRSTLPTADSPRRCRHSAAVLP
jgi:hypothetical protein